MTNKTKKIDTLHLFQKLDQMLVELLGGLTPEEWQLMPHPLKWRIKDLTAHLLDGNIRGISMGRDGYFGETPENIKSYADLLSYLNTLNSDWVKAMRRVSPAVLVALLDQTALQYREYLQTLDPDGEAVFSVAWAGEEVSPNWFHIAREYTEKWHHQQQIRCALGRENDLLTKELYYPYLETSMRALPFHYRNKAATNGEILVFEVEGPGGGIWNLLFENGCWNLVENSSGGNVVAEVKVADKIAWRIFTKGISRQDAIQSSSMSGNEALSHVFFDTLAVMA